MLALLMSTPQFRELLDAWVANTHKSRHETKPWKQSEVDTAVRELKANYRGKRHPDYDTLVKACQAGKAAATKEARERFGQRSLIRKLELTSPAFLERSEDYRQIKAELGLGKRKRPREVGLSNKALDDAARNNWKSRRADTDADADGDALLKAHGHDKNGNPITR